MFKILRNVIKLFILIVIVFSLFYIFSNKKPSLDRNWSEDSKILPNITITDNTVDVKNLRDWRYGNGAVLTRNYYNESYDFTKITKAYFLVNPFGKWEGVGHTFFLFEFSDGNSVAVSVEARREEGVEYSAIKGLFNNYEMWYAWGSAADLLSKRAIYSNEDLYMYPLLIKPETARGLFIDLAKATEGLETRPKFYNTLTSNCTNVLADSANRVNKGSIPWNFARIFTGFADDKLYDLKLIPHDKPFEQINKEARIDEKIRGILGDVNSPGDNSKMDRGEFWKTFINRSQ